MKSSSRPPSRLPAKAPGGVEPDSPEREELVVVGRIGRAHALKGRVRLQPEVDDPAIFRPGLELWTRARGGALERFEVEQADAHRSGVLLKFKGIDSIEQVEKHRGQLLYMRPAALPELPEDEFYYYELIGCKVVLPDESTLGEIEEIQPGASGDLIVVRQGEKEVLIPAVREFVKLIDLRNRMIQVDLPEGLL